MRRHAPRSDQPGNLPGSRFNETDGRHAGTRPYYQHKLRAQTNRDSASWAAMPPESLRACTIPQPERKQANVGLARTERHR